ncbi:MAG: hypothetical protein J6P46_02380 [Bacteroidales bacterium]|nr:hypothetical protein [Bacteroidales bacterium]
MKKESFDVYESPEAEEVRLVIESTILSGLNEDPNCPTYGSCPGDYDVCIDDDRH